MSAMTTAREILLRMSLELSEEFVSTDIELAEINNRYADALAFAKATEQENKRLMQENTSLQQENTSLQALRRDGGFIQRNDVALLLDAIRDNKKIQAIKQIRFIFNLGLKESKDMADGVWNTTWGRMG